MHKVERALGIENLYAAENGQLVNHLIQALKAESLYKHDVEYIVQDGEVKIVDEFTGRIMEGRRWSEGLHQAVEAKEGVRIEAENVTVATITIQNYFRLYEKLAGMTGTAYTEANEFHEIYKLDVIPIPTQPADGPQGRERLHLQDQGREVPGGHRGHRGAPRDGPARPRRHDLGRGLRVPGRARCRRRGIPHNVLNAKNHEHEAADHRRRPASAARSRSPPTWPAAASTSSSATGIRELGGLYIVGTERHESRRIDNQLRGRSGRQGDPGETRFFLSAEDDLVRLFAGDRIYTILDKLGPGEGEPIEHGMLTKRIEGAQKRVEEQNFDIRKNVLKYDDVLNKQRTVIYDERREVLEGADLDETVLEWIDEVVERAVEAHTESPYAEEWDLDGMFVELHSIYPVSFTAADLGDLGAGEVDREDLIDRVVADARRHYEQKDVLLEERFTGWIAGALPGGAGAEARPVAAGPAVRRAADPDRAGRTAVVRGARPRRRRRRGSSSWPASRAIPPSSSARSSATCCSSTSTGTGASTSTRWTTCARASTCAAWPRRTRWSSTASRATRCSSRCATR